jgi:hypothetical protein
MHQCAFCCGKRSVGLKQSGEGERLAWRGNAGGLEGSQLDLRIVHEVLQVSTKAIRQPQNDM